MKYEFVKTLPFIENPVGFDTETDMSEGPNVKIELIQVYDPVKDQVYLVVTKEFSREDIAKWIETLSVVVFSAQADLVWIYYNFGVLPKELHGDPYLLARITQQKESSLSDLCQKLIGKTKPSFLDMFPLGLGNPYKFSPEQLRYVAADPVYVWRLNEAMIKIYEKHTQVYTLELKLAEVLAKMSAKGLIIDEGRFVQASHSLKGKYQQALKKCEILAGFPLRPNSSKDKLEAIMKRGIKVPEGTKMGKKGEPSMAKEILEQMMPDSLIEAILEASHLLSVNSSLAKVPEHFYNR